MTIRLPFMLLWICLLLLIASPSYAEEGADLVATAAAGESPLVAIVTSALGVLLAWAFKLLREKWKIEAQHEALDATKSLWEQRNFLIDNRIIPFAFSNAEHWLLTQLPAIIKDATDGDGFAWDLHWKALRGYTRQRVIAKFAAENVDVIALLGEHELNNLLDRVLLRLVGKLPESVQRFLPASVVDNLTDAASSFITRKGRDLLVGM
jgi:hypothetical protein